MPRGSHSLFSQKNLRDLFDASHGRMTAEIQDYEAASLLDSSIDDLVEYFVSKFYVEPIYILEDQISVDQVVHKIDVSQDKTRDIVNRNVPHYVAGLAVILFVPFEGDVRIFEAIPSTFDFNPPYGEIRGQILELTVQTTNHDATNVKHELEQLLSKVRQYVKWAKTDVVAYNDSLQTTVQRQIEARRQKLLRDQGLVSSLGFPLRQRANTLATYIAPEVRRKPPIKLPPVSRIPYVPEPILEIAEYENILSIIQKTASVLERSPHAFRGMDEEALRDQFLVPLNSHYEGQATGETFNSSGKTDILVRDGDRSVFIAECKIWRGAKALGEAIDQLLSYATWRDTKTAILLFNRNKDLSLVLEQIPAVLQGHPEFKRSVKYASPTGFRTIIAHRHDKNREMILTVLVFDVPK